jgi:hypothetical protein
MQTTIQEYGSVQDLQFPNVPPKATEQDIKKMAKTLVKEIKMLASQRENQPFVAHVMGEMTLMFRVVKLLKRAKIKCVASTTERNTIEHPDGSKTFKFDFQQFREYS